VLNLNNLHAFSINSFDIVALMRHSLIRLFRLLEVDVHWYVTRPQPAIFDITKRKIHDVLQGVSMNPNADEKAILTEEDEHTLEEWCRQNAERYWEKGPFRNLDVIVVDDPQRK
jgi:alpha,alpha-trehalose phosphorylase (configuration-retaining)